MRKFKITSFSLHILAMVFMLCDHLWATVIVGNDWLTCVGRIAFPIFAFLTVEGYFHTKDIEKYLKRLFVFALISEIPFNLMVSGVPVYPFHQNVLWTFLIALSLIRWNEKGKNTNPRWKQIGIAILSLVIGAVAGLLTMVDYYHFGVLTVLTFYFFRGKKWWNYPGQLLFLYMINVEMMGGLVYVLELFGKEFLVPQQGFALLSCIPIWLYSGEQGFYNKTVRNIYYWFYPAHMLILALLGILL